MYLKEKIKKPISVILSLLIMIAYIMPYSFSFAETAYDFQGKGGNTLKMTNYENQITVVEETDEHYLNSINTNIDMSEDIVFEFTMTAGINAFGDGANFKKNCMPYIKIYDGEWKDVVVEYDDGNGLLKYIGFADRIISIGVEKDKLPEGDYILVFGAEVCGNNLAKNLGIPVAFKFTTCDNYAGEVDKAEINKLIAEVEEFVFEATVGSEKGQYPSKDEIEAAIADAKAVSENTSATRREVTAAIQALNNAFDEFKKSMVVDVQSVSITSEKKESVYVGQRGTISTEIKVDPDEDQYKEIEYTTSENISIDSDTGKWKALSPGDAYIKVASKKDSTKYDIYEFTVLAREGVDTIIVEAGSTLQSAIDEMLEGTENTYAYFTSIKIITEEGVNLTSDDCTFINKNLTSLEKLDLTEVTFVDYLPESAFKNNTSLKEVVLPDYITTIGSGAFDGCTSLQKVALPSKLRTIASYAFRGCTSLENIEIPSLVVTIGTDAFNGCTSLGTVLKSNAVEPPTMPSTNPFGGTNIATIVVPYGGGDRYKNASIWKDFEIIESEELVLNLEVQAPGTLKEVAEATIKNLGLDGTEVFSLNIKCAEGVVLNSDDEQYIKESFSTAVKIDLSKANFENNKLPDEIFKNRLLIEAVVLPESMTTIGKNAFSGSRNLASINMPNNLETIEDYAFASCSSITLDKLPDSIANIGEGAFEYCIGLKLTQLPSKLTSISDYSFRSCSKLALTALPDGIKTIGKNAFYGCTGLVEVSMPSELVSVDEYAFYSCTKLKTLTLPEGFNSIGNSGFGYCKAIETLNLPDSLTEIGDSAFYGDYGIVTLNMSDNVTRIGKKAFSYCMDMKLDELPDSLEIIDNNGFLMCENMTVSVLPESLVHIGNNAFNGCTNISIATIPASVNYIGHNSFIACTSMPEKLNVLAKVPPTLGADAFLDSSVTTICVPSESLDSYKADSSWSAYNIIAIDKALVNITFNLNNGEENIVKTVLAGSKVSYAPKAPVKKGYVFVGWYENVDNINTAYKNGSTYTKNVTYTAKYAHVQMLGAQVKAVANDMSGIRFGTRIYDDGDEIVEKGTLIIPVKVLGAGEALTLDTEKAARSVGKVNYEVNEQQNYVTYLGTIINIPRAQFDAEMTASAYVIYKDKAGNEYTVYSNYPNQSTSIKKLLGI